MRIITQRIAEACRNLDPAVNDAVTELSITTKNGQWHGLHGVLIEQLVLYATNDLGAVLIVGLEEITNVTVKFKKTHDCRTQGSPIQVR